MSQVEETAKVENKDEIIKELRLKLIRTEKAYLLEHSKVCQMQYEKLCEEELKYVE